MANQNRFYVVYAAQGRVVKTFMRKINAVRWIRRYGVLDARIELRTPDGTYTPVAID